MSVSGRTWIDGLRPELSGQQAILRRLLGACETDPDIRWLVIGCSLARDVADRFSDLDLAIGVADDRFDQALPRVHEVVNGLADLVESFHHQLPEVRSPHERIFAQYADRCQVDLVVFQASEPIGSVPVLVVLYDPGALVTVDPQWPAVTPEQVREWAFTAWCALADLGKYLRRCSVWEAHARLQEARGRYWQLWSVAHDIPNPQFGLTSVLDFGSGRLPAGISPTVATLEPADLLAAGQHLADVLASIGELLRAEHRAVLPEAMASFIRADLASIRIDTGSGTAFR